MLSDELNRQGWDLPVLSKTTQQKLSAILPPESAIGNPIDCLPSRNADQIRDILKVLAQEEKDNIDIIAIILGDSGMSDNSHIYREISMAMDDHPIPIVPVLASVTNSREKINAFKADGKIYFFDEVSLGSALLSISTAVKGKERELYVVDACIIMG